MSGTKAPVFAVSRHRLGTDGAGVTTLVGFRGCPLGCRYCLNPECVSDGVKTLYLTPEELYNRVKQDRLYFLATGGGVTFGGGEPLSTPISSRNSAISAAANGRYAPRPRLPSRRRT